MDDRDGSASLTVSCSTTCRWCGRGEPLGWPALSAKVGARPEARRAVQPWREQVQAWECIRHPPQACHFRVCRAQPDRYPHTTSKDTYLIHELLANTHGRAG